MSDIDFLKKGRELLESGNIEDAVKYLDKAYANDPDNDKILNILGLAYFKSGRLENAYQIYRKLINKNPDNATLRLNIGVLLYKKKEYQLALEELVIAEKLEPDNHKISLYKGMCFEQERDYSSAMAEYKKSQSDKNVKRMEEKIKTHKTKFKIKDDSKENKNITTEDIIVKHFGKKAMELENIENEDDIDRVFSEKKTDEGEASESDDGFFDSTKLTEEFDEENEAVEAKKEEVPEDEVQKEDKAENDNIEKETLFTDEDIDFATDELLKSLDDIAEESNLDDSFDQKVEDFLKSHQKKEDEEYKSGLQDTNIDVDSGSAEKDTEPEEEREEELEKLEEQVKEYLKDEYTEIEHKKEGLERKIYHPITLEGLTSDFILKCEEESQVTSIESDMVCYSFNESFIYKTASAAACSGDFSEYIPKKSEKSQKMPESMADKYSWISGEGRIFLKPDRRILIPVAIAEDVFTVNLDKILGIDGSILREIIVISEDSAIAVLEGKGNLFLSLRNELISFSIEEGSRLLCQFDSFLGFMGNNTPIIVNDEKIKGNVLEVSGPGIAFLIK